MYFAPFNAMLRACARRQVMVQLNRVQPTPQWPHRSPRRVATGSPWRRAGTAVALLSSPPPLLATGSPWRRAGAAVVLPRRSPCWPQARIYAGPVPPWPRCPRCHPAGDRLASTAGRRRGGLALLTAAPAGDRLAVTAGRRRGGWGKTPEHVCLKFGTGLHLVC